MLLKSSDVARVLNGVSTRTLDRMRQRGEIKWLRIGRQVRFRPEDLEEYLCRAHENTFNAIGLEALGISGKRIAAHKKAQADAAAVAKGREIALKVQRADELRASENARQSNRPRKSDEIG